MKRQPTYRIHGTMQDELALEIIKVIAKFKSPTHPRVALTKKDKLQVLNRTMAAYLMIKD